MAKKRDKAVGDAKPTNTSMRKAARDAAREAIAAEGRAIIDLVESEALAAAAEAGGGAGSGANGDKRSKRSKGSKDAKGSKGEKAGKPGKGEKSGKGKKSGKSGKSSATVRASGVSNLDDANASTDSDPDEGGPDFARLTEEIDGLVRLVRQHRPEVRRAVFDSYVTAVVEFGATANDLGLVDVRDGTLEGTADDASAGEADSHAASTPAVGPLRRSFDETAVSAPRGPVREAQGFERTATAPRRARSSVNGGKSGVAPTAARDATDADLDETAIGAPATESAGAAPRGGRRRTPAKGAPTLEELAAAQPPRNNDQRNLLIVQAHELAGTSATLPVIEGAYERMGWRVPANLRASLRQSLRKGLVLLNVDGESYRAV
ncbi:MAG: hypothetical protein ACTH31_03395 [Pseudoclavibacter sp.]